MRLSTKGRYAVMAMADLAGNATDVKSDPRPVALADIAARDARDSDRSTAPLRRADDAALLDTSELGIAAAVQQAIALVEAAMRRGGQQQI